MLVNFQEIIELAVMIYEFGQPVVVDGLLVTEFNFPLFISMYYDA